VEPKDSSGLTRLAQFVDQCLSARAGDRAVLLERFFEYLRACYGPTPLAAIASDQISDAQGLIRQFLLAFDAEEVRTAGLKAQLPVPLLHWCLGERGRSSASGDHASTGISYAVTHGQVLALSNGVVLGRMSELTANVYRSHASDEDITFEIQVPPLLLFAGLRPTYLWEGWGASGELISTGEYAGYHVFGHLFFEGQYLRMTTSVPKDADSTELRFIISAPWNEQVLRFPLILGYRSASHLSRLRGMWWDSGSLFFAGKTLSISVRRSLSLPRRIFSEIVLLFVILRRGVFRRAVPTALKAMVIRLLFHLTPWMKRRRIWFLHDKMYTASDCGEYLYWHVAKNEKSRISPVYSVNHDAPEAVRLRSARASLNYPGTIKQALQYLHAEVILTTYPDPVATIGLTGPEYLRDLMTAPIVCIQHGLTMQDLARSMHQGHSGIARYYCASPREVENLARAEYGYRKDQLALTGIPRFDGLVASSEPVIVLSLTWRPEYASPTIAGHQRRRENDAFGQSLYAQILGDIVCSRDLLDRLDEADVMLHILLHPNVAANKDVVLRGLTELARSRGLENLFTRRVAVLAAGIDTSYDHELATGRVLITDYSGIQYDFAYMRKAIIYFHSAAMPPQYGAGAMDYAEHGFGPITNDITELATAIVEIIDRGGSPLDYYRPRYDDFFAFRDAHSCERITADLCDWLRSEEPSQR
jgi:hypothetical protein